MAGKDYTLLLSEVFKRHLDSLDLPELQRMREKLEFLASGLWDSGLRVKKLRGTGTAGSVVFEARMSKSDRLLFTLGRERGAALVYVWGLERHDDVDRAKRSVLPENAPFLGFEPLSVEEREGLVFDDLAPEYFSQESPDDLAGAECGPQRWRVLDDSDWRRLLASSDRRKADLRLYLTEEQRNVLEQPPPLFLSGTAGSGKTTIAVYYLFRPLPSGTKRLFVTNHPYLCAYSEGLYDGLAAEAAAAPAPSRPRFAPYRDIVRELLADGREPASAAFDPTREVDFPAFELMLRDRKEFSSLDPELAWEEIRGIIKGAKPALNLGRYRGLVERFASGLISRGETGELVDILGSIEGFDFMPRIEALIAKKTSFADYGDFLRFHYEGRQADRSAALYVHAQVEESLARKASELRKPLLSFPEYQALGKKRAPNFHHDREGIYAAAEWYQSRLGEGGLWDEIDLTRRAIDELARRGEASTFEPWDLIVCDEAQDFTNIHVFLLFRLVSDPSSVVLAGDVKQIVNPSGFRWADMRALFWERGLKAPGLFRLGLNFRSVGGIVSLGNALLDLKKRLVGIQADEIRETWKFRGKSPCLLVGPAEAAVVAELSDAGAGNAIIVRDVETRERIKALTRSELVFTILEAKGLEFDSVLLWKPTPPSGRLAALWRRISGDDRLAGEREARIVHEINLYYVAVTRARNALVVYEDNADFWDQDEFAQLYIRSSDTSVLKDSWRTLSAPEEWKSQGDYYFERGYWKASAECYKNAGEIRLEALALGLDLFAQRRFAEAAGLLETGGLADKAAFAYESSGDFAKAAQLWEAEGDGIRSRRCSAQAREKEKRHAQAAALWLELGDREAALRNLERTDDHAALAELCFAMKQWEKAAKAYAACGRHLDEAECWRKDRNQKKAAEAYYSAGEWEKAARYFKLSRQYEKIPGCWLRAGSYDKAAASHLECNAAREAVEDLRRWLEAEPAAAESLREQAAALEAKKPLHAAVRLAALGDWSSAGRLFMKHGKPELALEAFRSAQDHTGVSRCLEAQEDYHAAALEMEGVEPDSERAVRLLERYLRKGIYGSSVDRRLADRLNEEALAFEAEGDLDRAVNRFVAIGHVKAAYRCLMELDRDDVAFGFFADARAYDELGGFIRDKKRFRLSHEEVMLRAGLLVATRFASYYLASWPLLLEALGRYRGEADREDPEFQEELAALLPMERLTAYKTLAAPEHIGIVDFLIRIGHLNGLMLLWRNAVSEMGQSTPYYTEFVRRIEAASSSEGTRSPWFAILLRAMRTESGSVADGAPVEFDLTDPGVEGLGPWNTLVYVLAPPRFSGVFAWYHEQGKDEDLAAFVKFYTSENLLASFYDERGQFGPAATWYERVGSWDEALRCHRAAGDEAGTARMLEKLGRFDEALEIWKKLERDKDIRRMQKAIASGRLGRVRATRAPAGSAPPGWSGQLDLF